jgi:NADPH:quinone reductase-like Zn-dependent oxidoreductase
MLARLQPAEFLLVHGGASGIGTMAIQLGKVFGAHVTCTVGSAEKAARCRELGADRALNYREDDFVEAGPFDVILDIIGAKYLARNVAALATNGRLSVIGTQGGTTAELDLRALLGKRAAIMAAGLRARPVEEKTTIVSAVRDQVWPLLESGEVRAVIDRTFPMAEAARAHEILQDSGHVGKLVLTV